MLFISALSSDNVRLFKANLDPLIAFAALLMKLKSWENPLASFCVLALLLNMAMRDLLVYFPAIVVFCNILLVVPFHVDPLALQKWLRIGPFADSEVENTETSVETIVNASPNLEKPQEEHPPLQHASTQSQLSPRVHARLLHSASVSEAGADSPSLTSRPNYVNSPRSRMGSALHTSAPEKPKKEEEQLSLLARLKKYRDVAYNTKDYLQSVQHSLYQLNMKMLRVDGLYKWNNPLTTWKFLILLTLAFLWLVFVPFKYLFILLTLDFFSDKFQSQGSFMDRLLQEVKLPAKPPELD